MGSALLLNVFASFVHVHINANFFHLLVFILANGSMSYRQ